jgi:hypothetical protein
VSCRRRSQELGGLLGSRASAAHGHPVVGAPAAPCRGSVSRWWSAGKACARSRQVDVVGNERVEPAFLPMLYGCLPPVFGWSTSSRRDGALTWKRPGRSQFLRLSKVTPVGSSCPSWSPCSVDHRGNALVSAICPLSSEGTPRWTNRVVTTPWVGPWPCIAGSASCRGARDRKGRPGGGLGWLGSA